MKGDKSFGKNEESKVVWEGKAPGRGSVKVEQSHSLTEEVMLP